jgi:hypothetical protein
MGGMKINFAEVESSFEPLPEGEYEVIIEKVEVRESKSSEHNYLNWEFNVQDDDYEDRKLWNITSLSPRALFRLKDDLLALEVIEEDEELDLEWDEEVDITPTEGPLLTNPDLEGIACVVNVTNEPYEGKERNRVSSVRLSDGDGGSRKKAAGKKATGGKAKGGKRKRNLR